MLRESDRLAREARLRRFERTERWKVVAAVIVGVALLAAAAWTMRYSEMVSNQRDIAGLCQADYARARSAVDSQVVDRRRPIIDPETDAPAGVSCGEIRRAAAPLVR
jgi:hypothetical protein